MNAAELNAAMQYIDDDYLDIADAPQKEIIQMSKTKNITRILVAAAVIAMLSLTAYAADFLHIKSLNTVTTELYTAYQQLEAAMDQAGFRMTAPEAFSNGFTFDNVHVQEVDARDENDSHVLTYMELMVYYRNASGARLLLCAEPYIEELPASDHALTVSRTYAGVSFDYNLDHYRSVPDDYQLTEEDEAWQAQPGNYISYGFDGVEEHSVAFLSWEMDGIRYVIMDPRASLTQEDLFAMGEEVVK